MGLHFVGFGVNLGVLLAREPLNMRVNPLIRTQAPQHAPGRRFPDACYRARVRVREHARGCAASRADRVAVIAIVRGSDGSWIRLLAVLTLQCAAKAHWWHGGQPTQDTTYRVNVRTGGPTLHLSGERAHEGAQVAVCWLRYGRLRLRLRAAGCGCAVGCAQRVNRRLSCEYSSAPPEPGRGAAAHNNQAFCSTPCMANMRTTMIVLLRAWNSHE